MQHAHLALLLLLSAIFFSCDVERASVKKPVVSESKSEPVSTDTEKLTITSVSERRPVFANPRFQKGVSLGLFVSDTRAEKQREIYTQLVDEIVAVGATHISITIRWQQQNVSANTIAPGPDSASDDVLLSTIGYAKKKGLSVFLMPYLTLAQRSGSDWRGVLKPTDRAAWWKSYRAFILHFATIALSSNVDLYAVGSELLSMERDAKEWKSLIDDVRKTASNIPLIYSANWDRFETVRFWNELDYIGISAYQPLAKSPKKTSDFASGWRQFQFRLSELKQRTPVKNVIFTEVGYPSNTNGAVRPWDYTASGSYAPVLQSQLIQTLFDVWAPKPYFEGAYIWNWFGKGGEGDRDYTLRGKPAASVLRSLYSTPNK